MKTIPMELRNLPCMGAGSMILRPGIYRCRENHCHMDIAAILQAAGYAATAENIETFASTANALILEKYGYPVHEGVPVTPLSHGEEGMPPRSMLAPHRFDHAGHWCCGYPENHPIHNRSITPTARGRVS